MPANKPSAQVFFHHLVGFPLTNRIKLKKFIISLFKAEGVALAELNYIFCDDSYLLQINQQYLQHDFYTDIITFDLSESKKGPKKGEIYISVDRVRDNAQNFNSTFTEEIHRVIFHGALHLCGYKDKSQKEETLMREKENYYLRRYQR